MALDGQKKVTLLSSDGEGFEVDEAAAVQSQTIRHMIEDGCAHSNIPLPNVTSQILAKVIEYCNKRVDAYGSTGQDGAAEGVEDEGFKAWEAEFVNVDQPTLFDLILQQQMSYWASLPPASLQFPPLLPLPTKATRSTEKQAKPVNQRKGSGSSQARVERKVKEEEECIYSLSPPPSDLPLPSFVLTMQKNKGVAVEAAAGDAR
ncbi:hypothetical protein ZIOFF_022955 [Zingiber officinale]|uniref:SKP1 component POZ domain-containing protein n=1 Tax=Zingiber officinale TaxID=94328 RepID=A0A8J5H2A1_ZINOF|nr:hypothetical protein ZIOFF_022955 [Zingiber officinale]